MKIIRKKFKRKLKQKAVCYFSYLVCFQVTMVEIMVTTPYICMCTETAVEGTSF